MEKLLSEDCNETCLNKKLYECNICSKVFTELSRWINHKSFECDVRMEGFSQVKQTFLCNMCEKHFTNQKSLNQHKRTHATYKVPSKPYECDFCAKCFKKPSHLVYHKRNHTREKKPHQCGDCQKSFDSPSLLVCHKWVHMREKLYKCDVCNKGFSSLTKLTRHKGSHNGVKPFESEIFKKKFSQQTALNSHQRTHSDDRPYGCTCKEQFVVQKALETHVMRCGDEPPKEIREKEANHCIELRKVTHFTSIPVLCRTCGKEIFMSHLQKLPSTAKTQIPIKDVTNQCNLCQEIESNEMCDIGFVCSLCGLGFDCLRKLEDHIVTHQ